MKKIASMVLVSALAFTNCLCANLEKIEDNTFNTARAEKAAADFKFKEGFKFGEAFYALVGGVVTLVVVAVSNDNSTTTTHMSTTHH